MFLFLGFVSNIATDGTADNSSQIIQANIAREPRKMNTRAFEALKIRGNCLKILSQNCKEHIFMGVTSVKS